MRVKPRVMVAKSLLQRIVVSLGKGEVDSSILSGSTMTRWLLGFSAVACGEFSQ